MSKQSILIVDDQGVVVRLNEVLLARTGAEVVTAKSGAQAIEKAAEHVPTVVVMDWEMPDMNGEAVTRYFRGHSELSRAKIVIVTGHGDEQTRRACMDAGADYFVTKPIEPNNLLDLIRSILRT